MSIKQQSSDNGREEILWNKTRKNQQKYLYIYLLLLSFVSTAISCNLSTFFASSAAAAAAAAAEPPISANKKQI